MKYKLLTKWGISFALIISIFFNSVGSIFAKSEQAQEQVFESQKEEVTRKVSIEKEISLEAESDKVEKEEVLTQERQTASYTLSKSKFQEIYHNQNGYQGNPYVNTVAFTDQPLPAGTTIVDISENGDGSVLACNDNGNLIVTSNTPGVKVKLPSDSSFLFSLEVDGDAWNRRRDSIDVSYVDTSEVTNMQAMFWYYPIRFI